MGFKIIFDEHSTEYNNEVEFNLMIVKQILAYLKDSYEARGYVYLNNIYETLGIEWDPYIENKCWIYKRDGELNFKITEQCSENKILISF